MLCVDVALNSEFANIYFVIFLISPIRKNKVKYKFPGIRYFTSCSELEEKIKSYEQSNSVQLWKREARTVASATKRVDRYLKPDLKYYQLKYCCIHGGKEFQTDGKGIRQNTM